MRILKIILGLGCLVAAPLPGMLALYIFCNLGPEALFWHVVGTSEIAVFAISLVGTGWFLIASRNKVISMRTKLRMIVSICAGSVAATLILPLLSRADSRNWQAEAEGRMKQLELNIRIYQDDYGRFPIPTTISNLSSNDFTFGTWNTSVSALGITNATGGQANNSKIIAILRAWKDGPEPDFFRHTNADGVLLDPWDHPYIITLDLNRDGRCGDAFYRLAGVSEINRTSQVGLNGLTRPTPPPYSSSEARDSFEAPGRIMIWSLGRDGKADRTKKANAGVNKDNLLLQSPD